MNHNFSCLFSPKVEFPDDNQCHFSSLLNITDLANALLLPITSSLTYPSWY